MTAVWPVTLPQKPLVQGNSGTLGDNRTGFKPDVGRAILRRRYTTRDDNVAYTFRMTQDQFNDFLTFYGTDLGDGVLPFTYDDPTIGTVRTYQFDRPPAYSYTNPIYVDVACVWIRHGV